MKGNLLLISLALIWSAVSAQDNRFQRKIDSMTKRFRHADSLRKMNRQKDTVKNELVMSPFTVIYQEAKPSIVGVHQVQLQLVRFRQAYFLNIELRAGNAKPVAVPEKSSLELKLANGNIIRSTVSGRAVPHGSEQRNSSTLKMIYGLTRADVKILKDYALSGINIAYDTGRWPFSIAAGNAERLRSAIKTI